MFLNCASSSMYAPMLSKFVHVMHLTLHWGQAGLTFLNMASLICALPCLFSCGYCLVSCAILWTNKHDHDTQYLITGVCGTCEYATEGGRKFVRLCTRPLTEGLLEDNSSPAVLMLKKSTRPCNPSGPVKYL